MVRPRFLPEETGRPMDEVRLVPGNGRVVPGEMDGAGRGGLEMKLVREGDRLEKSPDVMVAVRPLADDLQAEVDLGE